MNVFLLAKKIANWDKFPVTGFVMLFILWEIVSLSGILNSFLFPSPVSVIERFFELFLRAEIFTDLSSTLIKIFTAIIFGSAIGFGIGVLLARWEFVYKSLSPMLDFFRSIPATALFPLFLIIIGAGDLTNTALVMWVCAIYLSLYVSKGLRSTSEDYLLMARSLRKSNLEIFLHVRLREALPFIFVGLRTAVSLAVVVIIVTEMFIGTSHGLGKALIDAAYSYDMTKLYATIIIVGLIGYFLNRAVIYAEGKMVHWEGK